MSWWRTLLAHPRGLPHHTAVLFPTVLPRADRSGLSNLVSDGTLSRLVTPRVRRLSFAELLELEDQPLDVICPVPPAVQRREWLRSASDGERQMPCHLPYAWNPRNRINK